MDYSTLALELVMKYNITDATMTDIEKIAHTIERIGLEKTEKLLSIGID